MSKHTPGPWSHWSGYNHMDKIEAEVTAEGGDIVIASYNHLIEEGEANASLIAAAPDLLQVARAAELFAKGEALPTRQQLLESAQKAIAKARGEQ